MFVHVHCGVCACACGMFMLNVLCACIQIKHNKSIKSITSNIQIQCNQCFAFYSLVSHPDVAYDKSNNQQMQTNKHNKLT